MLYDLRRVDLQSLSIVYRTALSQLSARNCK